MGDAKKKENEENEENEKKDKGTAVFEESHQGGAIHHLPTLFNVKPPPSKGRRRKTNAEKANARAAGGGGGGSASPSAAAASASPSAAAPSRVYLKPEDINANNHVIINRRGFTLAKNIKKRSRRSTRRHRTKQNRY